MEAIMLAPGVWNVIPNGMSAAYLVVGSERALLIDSGAGGVDVKGICQEITSLPVDVVNTHYHSDHIAANGDFKHVYMHPADIRRLENFKEISPVTEGSVFDLGGRKLEVIEIPGHTPGGIALYDRAANIMFTGDTVSKTPIFLVEGDYNLDDFESSLKKLITYNAYMYGAHDPTVNNIDTLEKLIETIGLFREGKIEPRNMDTDYLNAKIYIAPNGTGFLCPVRK